MGRRVASAAVIAAAIVAAFALAGCDGTRESAREGSPASEPTAGAARTTSPPASLGIDLGQASTQGARIAVTLSQAAEGFVPPAALPLYEIEAARAISRAEMAALAKRLGLEEPTSWAARGFANDEYSVEFPRSGQATCFTLAKKDGVGAYEAAIQKGESVPDCPSEEDTVREADALLARLGVPQGAERERVYVQSSVTTSAVGSPSKTWYLTRGVSYRTMVGGLPLLGPGAKVGVTVGPREELIEMKYWPAPASEGAYTDLRGLDLALKDLWQGRGLPSGDFEAGTSVLVQEVSLAYWAEPIPLEQPYYKPVYVFAVVNEAGKSGEWIVPAFETDGFVTRGG